MQSTNIHLAVAQILVPQCILLQYLKFPIIGNKPCWHDTTSEKLAVFTYKTKQIVQIRIQVSYVGAMLECWSLEVFSYGVLASLFASAARVSAGNLIKPGFNINRIDMFVGTVYVWSGAHDLFKICVSSLYLFIYCFVSDRNSSS